MHLGDFFTKKNCIDRCGQPSGRRGTRSSELSEQFQPVLRMTLPEKIAQLYSHWLILSPDGNHRIRTDAFAQPRPRTI